MPKGIPKSGVNEGWFKKGYVSWCKGLTKETSEGIARRSKTIGEKVRKKLRGKTYEEIYGLEKAKELREFRSKEKIGNKYSLGTVSWNKGLTKETDERIMKSSKKISKALTGPNNPFYGKHHTKETKRMISENNWTRRDTPEVKEKLIKNGMAGIAGVRKNRRTCRFMGVSFDSQGEMQTAIWLNKNFGFVPLERENCHVVVSGKEIDFFLEDKKLFLEYHPCNWYLNPETLEEYCQERNKVLQHSKYFDNKLIVVESLEELEEYKLRRIFEDSIEMKVKI